MDFPPGTHTTACFLTEASDYWGSGLDWTGSFCARAARFNQWQAAKATVLLPHSTRENSGKGGCHCPGRNDTNVCMYAV